MSFNQSGSSDNYSTLWVQQKLNAMAITRAQQEIQKTGRALPCKVTAVNGSLVTVSFEVANSPFTLPPITIPKAESQWMRDPTQIGDVGITIPADSFLGGISGQGSGIADVTIDYGNLATLVFRPIGQVSFPIRPDPNRAWVNGPNGFDATDTAQTVGIRAVKDAATVTIFAGNQTIVITANPSITDTVTQAAGALQQIVGSIESALNGFVIPGQIVQFEAVINGLNQTIWTLPTSSTIAEVQAVISATEPALQGVIPASEWGQITTAISLANTLVATITSISSALSSVQTILNGTTNQITHSVPNPDGSGSLQAKIDGIANAISLIVPSISGLVGLGAEAATIAATTHAAPSKADITTLSNNTISQTLQTLATNIGAAAVTAGIPGGAAFAAILGAAGWVAGLSGINPTIPACSSKVRVAP